MFKIKKWGPVVLVMSLLVACGSDREDVGWSDSVNDEKPNKISVVEEHGALSVDGTRIVDKKGNQIQLRGVSYPWHNWWPHFFNVSSVKYFVDKWQCSLIRVPMGVDADDKCYLKSPEASEKYLTTVVDAAIENGVYTIIDWHCHHKLTDEAVGFFDRMSKKYGGKPHVIYEIFNEPEGELYTWAEVKEYSLKVIDAIRKNDSKAIILVGHPKWDTDIESVAADPIEGYTNLAYTVHFYSKTSPSQYTADYGLKHNLPIFISECGGMSADGQDEADETSWKVWVNWMKENSVSWCAWTVPYFVKGGKTPESYQGYFTDWKENEITNWGRMVRAAILDK